MREGQSNRKNANDGDVEKYIKTAVLAKSKWVTSVYEVVSSHKAVVKVSIVYANKYVCINASAHTVSAIAQEYPFIGVDRQN